MELFNLNLFFLVLFISVLMAREGPLDQQLSQTFGITRSTFKDYFKTHLINMIYPSDLQKVDKLKRCVLAGPLLRGHNEDAVLKIELAGTSRSCYDESQNMINCHCDLHNKHHIPTEVKLNTIITDLNYFNKNYPEMSKALSTKNITVYVSSYLRKSRDLSKWSHDVLRDSMSSTLFEKYIRDVSKHLHSALIYLKRKNFIYTDYKPENVLVGNFKPKLIDLESVVNPSNKAICVYTPTYMPMFLTKSGFKDWSALKNEIGFYQTEIWNLAYDRVLTWTFVISIFQLTCANDLSDLNSKYNQWFEGMTFLQFYKCNKENVISNELKNFFNQFLTRHSPQPLFEEIPKSQWFEKVFAADNTINQVDKSNQIEV